MLSFTVVSKHACKQNSLLCYNDIKMCYFETSPYAMKCMLCHHLHSVLSIPIHDDAIKVSVPAASTNQSDILIEPNNRHWKKCKAKRRGSIIPDKNGPLQIYLHRASQWKCYYTSPVLWKKKTPSIIQVMSKN